MGTHSVIAAVVHELLNTEQFTNYSEFVDTVKWRCAKLRIPYDSGRVTAAVRLVERTRVTVRAPRPAAPWRPTWRGTGHGITHGRPFSRAEATALLRSLGVRL